MIYLIPGRTRFPAIQVELMLTERWTSIALCKQQVGKFGEYFLKFATDVFIFEDEGLELHFFVFGLGLCGITHAFGQQSCIVAP